MGRTKRSAGAAPEKSDKLRDPSLPPVRVGPFGSAAGEECGVIFGQRPACKERLQVEAGDRDELPRCPKHCREECRNVDALSAICPNPRMRGRRKCKLHGGRALAGALSPAYVDGRSSRWAPHAPSRYGELARMVAAGDPLDLSDDIHMVSARIAELLGVVDENGNPDFVKALDKKVGKLYELLEPQLSPEGFTLIQEITAMLKGAAADYSTWGEISGLFGQRVKMVESQRKRDLEGGKYVTAEEMVGMMRQLGLVLVRKIGEHVPDDAVRARLLADVSQEFAAVQGVDQPGPAEDQPGPVEDRTGDAPAS